MVVPRWPSLSHGASVRPSSRSIDHPNEAAAARPAHGECASLHCGVGRHLRWSQVWLRASPQRGSAARAPLGCRLGPGTSHSCACRGGFLGTLCCVGGGVIACGAGSTGSTVGTRFSRSRSATYIASWRSNAGHQLGSVPPPPWCGASGRGRRGPSPPWSPRCGPRSATSSPCVQTWRVEMRTTMLATITAPPRTIVQPGAPIASTRAVTSHAQANAKVAIAGRASCDTRGLATAAASVSKSTTSATTPNRTIEEVIAAGLSPRRPRQPSLV